jgi:hypothetical protein
LLITCLTGLLLAYSQFALAMLPPVARQAAVFNPKILLEFCNLTQNARKYSAYCWILQILAAKSFQHPVFAE